MDDDVRRDAVIDLADIPLSSWPQTLARMQWTAILLAGVAAIEHENEPVACRWIEIAAIYAEMAHEVAEIVEVADELQR